MPISPFIRTFSVQIAYFFKADTAFATELKPIFAISGIADIITSGFLAIFSKADALSVDMSNRAGILKKLGFL